MRRLLGTHTSQNRWFPCCANGTARVVCENDTLRCTKTPDTPNTSTGPLGHPSCPSPIQDGSPDQSSRAGRIACARVPSGSGGRRRRPSLVRHQAFEGPRSPPTAPRAPESPARGRAIRIPSEYHPNTIRIPSEYHPNTIRIPPCAGPRGGCLRANPFPKLPREARSPPAPAPRGPRQRVTQFTRTRLGS